MRCPIENTDRQRCTLEHPHQGQDHAFRPREAGELVGRVTTTPRCPGCGTTSAATTAWPRGAPCEVCGQQPRFQAPKATMEMGAQPEPAYQRGDYRGNFPPPGRSDG